MVGIPKETQNLLSARTCRFESGLGHQIMTDGPGLLGVYAPVLTPFTRDGAVDARSFAGFCRWLDREGVGLAVFGTNSEANSLTVEEKLSLLEALHDGGIPGSPAPPWLSVRLLRGGTPARIPVTAD